MASHFKLKATIEGEETVAESLTLRGNKSFKVFPIETNSLTEPIVGSAKINILGKNYRVQLNHNGKTEEDPESSSVKWSYLYPVYTIRDQRAPNNKDCSLAYIRASCGTTDTEGNVTLIVSKPYTTYQGLVDTVGDFSGNHYGEIQGSRFSTITHFCMYYKPLEEQGGEVIIPTDDDDDTDSINARIPCRPGISALPSWLHEPILTPPSGDPVNATFEYLIYVYTYNSEQGQYVIRVSRSYVVWESFIQALNDYKTNPDYTGDRIVFTYVLRLFFDINNSLNPRDSDTNTITIDEIEDDDGVIHGANPLYLRISQQAGFMKLHLGVIPASTSEYYDLGTPSGYSYPAGYYKFDTKTPVSLDPYRLPESNDNFFDFCCRFTPEFKLSHSRTPYRNTGAPLSDGVVNTFNNKYSNLQHDVNKLADGFEVYYQYIGKPVIFGAYTETPSGLGEITYLKATNNLEEQDSGMGGHEGYKGNPMYREGSWFLSIDSLLGKQTSNPFITHKSLGRSGNTVMTLYLKDEYRRGAWGVFSSNHYMFKLIPVCASVQGSMVWFSGYGVNEVNYFNQGKSAVISGDDELFKRAIYNDFNVVLDYTLSGSNPEYIFSDAHRDIGTTSGVDWENHFLSQRLDHSTDQVFQVLFLPMLFTDFKLEDGNLFESSSFGQSAIGRFYFSSPLVDSVDSPSNPILQQVVINKPLITYID